MGDEKLFLSLPVITPLIWRLICLYSRRFSKYYRINNHLPRPDSNPDRVLSYWAILLQNRYTGWEYLWEIKPINADKDNSYRNWFFFSSDHPEAFIYKFRDKDRFFNSYNNLISIWIIAWRRHHLSHKAHGPPWFMRTASLYPFHFTGYRHA